MIGQLASIKQEEVRIRPLEPIRAPSHQRECTSMNYQLNVKDVYKVGNWERLRSCDFLESYINNLIRFS